MKLIDVVHRESHPEPWSEGEKIPWNEPSFSLRMLREHLSQEHDAASRRFRLIDQHVDWIHHTLLSGEPTRILDLGCGPGLYATRLAQLGHECVGIDFSPASIAYAREEAARSGCPCAYTCEDIRIAEYGSDYGLAMLIFGEFNVFQPFDARAILDKVHDALDPEGLLLLEPHTYDAVQQIGGQLSWYSVESGLFSEDPHLHLYESIWDEAHRATIERYFIVDAQSGEVTPHASSMQAYNEQEYQALLVSRGFADVTFYPSLTGEFDESQAQLMAIVAAKGDRP